MEIGQIGCNFFVGAGITPTPCTTEIRLNRVTSTNADYIFKVRPIYI